LFLLSFSVLQGSGVLNGWVLGFHGGGFAWLLGLACGLLPALRMLQKQPCPAWLKQGSKGRQHFWPSPHSQTCW